MAKATFVHDGDVIAYTPGSAVASGDVVTIGDRCGIAIRDIAANAQGELAITGVFNVDKGVEAISLGSLLYWNSGNGQATATAPGNTFLGQCVKAADESDATVLVALRSGGGGGSGGGEVASAVMVVASVDAPQAIREVADYACDGVADNVEINAALQDVEAAGGGVVQLTAGAYYLAHTITPPDYTTLAGVGMDLTVIKATASLLTNSLVTRSNGSPSPYTTSPGSPAIGITIRDLTIDGEDQNVWTGPGQTGTKYTYSTHPQTDQSSMYAGKGVFMNYMDGCTFERVKLYRTAATGLGIDSLQNCVIRQCVAIGCGWARKIYGTEPWTNEYVGMYGFGLGYGGYAQENNIVVDCRAEDNIHAGFGWESTESGYDDPVTTGLEFQNCIARGNKEGFRLWDMGRGTMGDCRLVNCLADGNTSHGIYLFQKLRNITLIGCTARRNGGAGIAIGHSTDITNYNTRRPRGVVISGCLVTQNVSNGIYCTGWDIVISGNLISYNRQHGIAAVASSTCPNMSGLVIEGNAIVNNGMSWSSYYKDGIQIGNYTSAGWSQVSIRHNIIRDTGQSVLTNVSATRSGGVATYTYPASHDLPDGEYVTITGFSDETLNVSGSITLLGRGMFSLAAAGDDITEPVSGGTATRPARQRYGIYVSNGSGTALDKLIIDGNLFDNISLGIASDNTNWTNTRISNNRGYVTGAHGTATITNGNTSVNVTHGLAITPAVGNIQITPAGSLGSAGFFWVDTIGSTTFRINVNTDPGADVTFGWRVED